MTRSSLITLALFTGALLVLWFGVWGTFTNVRESQEIARALEQVLEREREAALRIEQQGEILSEYSQNIERIEQALPSERDAAAFIAALEEAASARGLVLESIDVMAAASGRGAASAPAQSRGVQSFSLQTTLQGTYSAARGLLRDLERSFPLVDVSNVSMRGEAGADEGVLINPTLDIQIMFDAYYLPVQ